MSNSPSHFSDARGVGQGVPFCKLKDVSRYVACAWDLAIDEKGRNYWVTFFKQHLNTTLKLGTDAAVTRGADLAGVLARADGCRREFYQAFDAFWQNPGSAGRVTILTLDRWRDDFLRRWGFVDAFLDLKNRENEKMLPLLPRVCAEIDALAGEAQFQALVLGLFAGNIFDMGADVTTKAFVNGSPDFFTTRSTLPAHPWLIDDYDCLAERMLRGPIHRKAVFFVDNAGSDFLLGAVPMIRWLARRGTQVVLAANERPTLNDMTLADVNAWWPRIVALEPTLADLPIDRVSTGTGEPLLDLSQISADLNAAARDADLVILEGMGRGVESNLEAEFSCDCLNIAMIKDTAVAERHGGKVFDVVCRFRNAG